MLIVLSTDLLHPIFTNLVFQGFKTVEKSC